MPNSPYNLSFIRNCLLWCFVLPQALLITTNIYGWLLVVGDAEPNNTTNALFIFSYQIGLLLFFTILWLQLLREKMMPTAVVAAMSLGLQVSYLFAFILLIDGTIPDKTQRWILQEGNVGRWNFTLLMPGLFLSLYALTKGVFTEFSTSRSTKISLVAVLLAPALWYMLVVIKQPLWNGQFSTALWILIGTAMVLAFLGALIKLVDTVTLSSLRQQTGHGHYIYTAIFALIFPLCGLYLNRTIDFPTNLQMTEVYALTLINAAILAIKPNSLRFLKTIVFLRFSTLPFTGYIFLIFLPFLPLSLFAVLAIGAGFLMLSPLLLGIFQFKVSIADFRYLKHETGTAPTLAIAFSGALILPSLLGAQAILDKQALHHTLEHFHSFDLGSPPLTDKQIHQSQTALLQLRARKESSQLPYISAIYNHIVFGQMVLSDKKIADTYRLLSNSDMPELGAGFLGHDRARGNWQPRIVPPHTDIAISAHTLTNISDTTTLRLTLLNNLEDTHALFHETITLPEGVFITGLRLKIDGAWVAGKIFDKKTALWVFKKITEVRRDPAIITYDTPHQLSLQVYPFPASGIREVELDFTRHSAINPDITLGELQLPLGNTEHKHIRDLTTASAQGSFAFSSAGDIVQSTSNNVYHFQREPYLHIVLDYSSGSQLSAEQYLKHIQTISAQLGVSRIALSAANIQSSENTVQILDIKNTQALEQAIHNLQLPVRAGFWCERALAHEIRRQDHITDPNRHGVLAPLYNVPIFIMLHSKAFNQEEPNCQYLPAAWQLPDINHYYRYTDNKLHSFAITDGEPTDNLQEQPLKLLALKQQDQIHLIPAYSSRTIATHKGAPITIFDPKQESFIANGYVQHPTAQPSAQWLAANRAWQQWKNLANNPARMEQNRSELLSLSRAANVLLPSTAFIVVEHGSQWEMLKRKEKQSLSNHSALDFDEAQDTPEPPEIILVIMLIAAIAYSRRRKLATEVNKIKP